MGDTTTERGDCAFEGERVTSSTANIPQKKVCEDCGGNGDSFPARVTIYRSGVWMWRWKKPFIFRGTTNTPCRTCGGKKERTRMVDRKPHREICRLCHEVSRVGFSVPDEIWAAGVHVSQIHEILCVRCFTRLADERGVEWDEHIEFYPVSRITFERCLEKKT